LSIVSAVNVSNQKQPEFHPLPAADPESNLLFPTAAIAPETVYATETFDSLPIHWRLKNSLA